MAARRKLSREIALVAVLAVMVFGPAAAVTPVDLQSCTKLSNDKERLACFDKAAAAPAAARGTAGSTAAPAPGHPEPQLTDEQKLGLSSARIQQLEAPVGHAAKPPIKELAATIQALSTNPSGRQVFTLENGQVWRQSEPDDRFKVSPGDSVRITPGALGSFWLSANTHSNTRVSRVR